MAEITINIPDDKVQLILNAYAEMKGIEPTAEMVKRELTNDIKSVVRQYRVKIAIREMTDVEVT